MKEDIETLKDDWLTDNVGGDLMVRTHTANLFCRSYHSGKSRRNTFFHACNVQ